MNKLFSSTRLVSLVGMAALVGSLGTTAYASSERADYGDQGTAQDSIGLFGGLAIGAAAGGPPGAIIGAAIGVMLSDGHRANSRVAELQLEVLDGRSALASLEQEAALLRQRTQVAEQQLASEKARSARLLNASLQASAPAREQQACCDNTLLSVHFRSGSSDIESLYAEQLGSLAKLARQMPTPRVEITGFTDRNGDAETNLKLSRARAEAVAALFRAEGVPQSAISTVGVGENQPLQTRQYFETDFFDRRVLVRLLDASQQFLSQNPERR